MCNLPNLCIRILEFHLHNSLAVTDVSVPIIVQVHVNRKAYNAIPNNKIFETVQKYL